TGATTPTGRTLTAFDLPSGPGIRVDTFGYAGYRTSAAFDSLLAKVIAHSPSSRYQDACIKAAHALREFRIEGVATNIPLLQALLASPDFRANRITTRFVDSHVAALVAGAGELQRPLYFDAEGPREATPAAAKAIEAPAYSIAIAAPLQGTVVTID